MARATASKLFFNLIGAAALACAPSALLAQHGGGHGGGGGFHGGGGGGFHGGGFSGGGGRSSAGGSSGGSYRPAPSAPRYSGGSSAARPAGNSYRPAAGNSRAYAGGGRTAGASGVTQAQAPHDGQWHSFAPRGSTSTSAGNSLAAGTPRGANGVAATRSFAGQGHEVYETTSPAATRSAALSGTVFSGLGRFGSSGGFSRLGPRFGFGFRTFPIFGRPFFGFGLGFGFGPGFGWGSCWGAAWAWDPFCFDSFAAWPPYGYYGYPPYDPYSYPPSVGYDPNYDPNNPDYNAPPSSSSAPSGPVNPNWDTSVNAPSASNAASGPVIIYLKDGTSFSPSDYWISDNQLHYVLGGNENTVDLDLVDLPHTNDENQKNGVKFWLKSAPDASPAPSDAAPAASPLPDSAPPTI